MAAADEGALFVDDVAVTSMGQKQLIALGIATLLVVSFVTVLAAFNDEEEAKQTQDSIVENDGWRAFPS